MGRKADSIETVKDYFEQRECVPLFTEYKTSRDKLEYICKCGNETTTTYFSFQRSNGCKSCSSTLKKHTLDDVKQLFIGRGCEPLFDNYTNTKQELDYICKCGKQATTKLERFQRGCDCWNCGNKKKGYSYGEVVEYFELQECNLLSTEYKNSMCPLKYVCVCGREASTTFNRFRNGHRCPGCLTDSRVKNTKAKIQERAQELNCKLIGVYTPNEQITLECLACSNETKITWRTLRTTWNGCSKCLIDKVVIKLKKSKPKVQVKQPEPYINVIGEWQKANKGNMYRQVIDSNKEKYLQVKLTQDYIMLCDNGDREIELLNNHRWIIIKRTTKKTIYVICKQLGKLFHNMITDYAQVDHINRNGLDNRRFNLRDGVIYNAKNKGGFINNTSGIKGVRFEDGPKARWTVQIADNGKRIKKSFSVQKYGYNQAKELAINCRSQLEIDLGYDTQFSD